MFVVGLNYDWGEMFFVSCISILFERVSFFWGGGLVWCMLVLKLIAGHSWQNLEWRHMAWFAFLQSPDKRRYSLSVTSLRVHTQQVERTTPPPVDFTEEQWMDGGSEYRMSWNVTAELTYVTTTQNFCEQGSWLCEWPNIEPNIVWREITGGFLFLVATTGHKTAARHPGTSCFQWFLIFWLGIFLFFIQLCLFGVSKIEMVGYFPSRLWNQ